MSIASRIESISNHLENTYDKLEDLGIDLQNTNKNLENLSIKLNELYEEWPKVTEEGTSIELTNTKKGKMETQLKGDLHQNTITGINLLPNITSQTVNGITITNNGDGSYTLNGTASTNTYFDFFVGTFDSTQYVNYYLKEYNYEEIKSQMGVSASTPISYRISQSNRTSLQGLGSSDLTGYIQIEDNGTNLYLALRIHNGGSLTNVVVKPMLVATSSDLTKEVEPYVGGVPSPNPLYPQPIKKVTGDNSIRIYGKNLFNFNDTYYTQKNGEISISGSTISMSTSYTYGDYVWWNIPVGKNKQVTISYSDMVETTTAVNNRIQVFSYETPITSDIASYNSLATNISKTTKKLTLTTTGNYLILTLRTQGKAYSYTISNIQVEYGDTNTTYEIGQSQIYPINLGSLEYCKIGTYQDYIYKDNDKWYLHKEIGKVVLNGSEDDWQVAAQSTNAYGYNTNISIYRTNNTTLYYSNYFTPSTFNQRYITNTFFINNNNTIVFATTETSLANFKTWLSTHNTEVYYVLATPYLSLIEDTTLINQLNTLEQAMSYDDQTNISQENDNLPFIINATALMKNSD